MLLTAVAVASALILTGCGGGEAEGAAPPGEDQSTTTGDGTGDATNGGSADGESPGDGSNQGQDPGDDNDGPPGRELPTLVDLSAAAGNTYSTVTLSFEPGQGQPSAEVEVSEDSTLTKPGSGKPVELAGDRALDVSIANSTAGDVEAITPGGPAIAEGRVLGFFEGRTNVGIGVYGDSPLDLQVDYDAGANEITVAVRNPTRDDGGDGTRQCGEVAFEPESDAGAFDITATGVDCATARAVAAAAEGQGGGRYQTKNGFSCRPEQVQTDPVPVIAYTCTRDEATVTFTT